MTESEFSSFDDALKQLELDEDDLKRLEVLRLEMCASLVERVGRKPCCVDERDQRCDSTEECDCLEEWPGCATERSPSNKSAFAGMLCEGQRGGHEQGEREGESEEGG